MAELEFDGGPAGVDMLFTGLPTDLNVVEAARAYVFGNAGDACVWN